MLLDKKNTGKIRRKFRTGSTMALSVFLCFLVSSCGKSMENENADDASEKEKYTRETIAYGEAEEWERWTDYLFSASAKEDYAVAFVQTGEASADFTWRLFDDREMFMTEVSDIGSKINMTEMSYGAGGVKEPEMSYGANAAEEMDSAMGKEERQLWYFVKMRLGEDIYRTDIYEYLNRNLAQEGYTYQICTLDGGKAYAIWHESIKAYEEDYLVLVKRDAVIRDGYLYVLSCEDGYEDNLEEINEILIGFEDNLNDGMYRTGTVIDEEKLYWTDHRQRITQLEEPARSFMQVRVMGLEFDSYEPYEHVEYFPLLTEAEYRISLSPELPEMEICFRYLEEIPESAYEIRLLYASAVKGPYRMEIRNAQDDSLIQRTDLELSIEEIDTITFEDIDEDGYLDMKIIFPLHETDDIYKYQDYWTWDKELEKLIRIEEEELLARREDNWQENPQTTNLSVIPVTVKKGDSLWKISVEYYGDGEEWIKIYEYNYTVIGDNPSLIYEGTELRLPWGRDWN